MRGRHGVKARGGGDQHDHRAWLWLDGSVDRNSGCGSTVAEARRLQRTERRTVVEEQNNDNIFLLHERDGSGEKKGRGEADTRFLKMTKNVGQDKADVLKHRYVGLCSS